MHLLKRKNKKKTPPNLNGLIPICSSSSFVNLIHISLFDLIDHKYYDFPNNKYLTNIELELGFFSKIIFASLG